MNHTKRFLYKTKPQASTHNIVSGDNYRFTILTPSLIRMEYSKDGIFENRASQTVFFRDFPKTPYVTKFINGILKIETENLIVTYKENESFTGESIHIKLKTLKCLNLTRM